MPENHLTVGVLGRRYELSGPEGEAHYKRVGEVVNRYIKEAALASGRHDPEGSAVFAALRLADEFLRAQAEADRLRFAREDALDTPQPEAADADAPTQGMGENEAETAEPEEPSPREQASLLEEQVLNSRRPAYKQKRYPRAR